MELVCPVCTSSNTVLLNQVFDVELHTSSDKFDYWNCEACDAIFIHPFPIDRLSEIYPDSYYSMAGPSESILERVKSKLDQRFLSKILATIPGSSLSVLDVGGGSGWMLNLARAADPRVQYTAVVDLNEKSRSFAEADGHVFHCSRVEDLESDSSFDLILVLNVIEHVANPANVFKNLAGLLTMDGKVVIKTPNTRTLDRYIFQNSYWGGYHCPRHWVLFNKENLPLAVKGSGLRASQIRYTQGASQWAASVLGVLSQRGWIRIDQERPMHRHFLVSPMLAFFALVDFIRGPFLPTAQMIAILEKESVSTPQIRKLDLPEKTPDPT